VARRRDELYLANPWQWRSGEPRPRRDALTISRDAAIELRQLATASVRSSALYLSAQAVFVEWLSACWRFVLVRKLLLLCCKKVRPEAAYLYDAVWIYARAAHAVLNAGLDPSNGTLVMDYIKGTTYRSELDSMWSSTDRLTKSSRIPTEEQNHSSP
jgi:hypothetical protein